MDPSLIVAMAPRFASASVLTEMPLIEDQQGHVECRRHFPELPDGERDCPAGAITDEKQLVRGVEKWYVDFDKCLPFFNEHHGCALCLAVCPWSTPGRAPSMAQKVERRRARKGLLIFPIFLGCVSRILSRLAFLTGSVRQ